jgi:soluble lytic murein transglycosylase-like protein
VAVQRCGAIVTLVTLVVASTPVSARDLYARVDADGHIHLSDVRKPGYRVLVRDPSAPPPQSDGGARVRWLGPHPGRCLPETLARIAREEGVPPTLLHAVAAVESACDPRAVSVKGAQGLMQLMPATATRYGVQRVFDPADNARGGARYLRDLIVRYPGRTDLVLAAYNAGEEAVARYANTVPPFPETREYVRRVMEHHDRLVTAGAPARTWSAPPAPVAAVDDRIAGLAARAR